MGFGELTAACYLGAGQITSFVNTSRVVRNLVSLKPTFDEALVSPFLEGRSDDSQESHEEEMGFYEIFNTVLACSG